MWYTVIVTAVVLPLGPVLDAFHGASTAAAAELCAHVLFVLLLLQVEQAAAGGCRIEHVLAVKPLLAIPAAIAPYTSSIFKEQVAALLQDLNREICRQVAEQAATN